MTAGKCNHKCGDLARKLLLYICKVCWGVKGAFVYIPVLNSEQ